MSTHFVLVLPEDMCEGHIDRRTGHAVRGAVIRGLRTGCTLVELQSIAALVTRWEKAPQSEITTLAKWLAASDALDALDYGRCALAAAYIAGVVRPDDAVRHDTLVRLAALFLRASQIGGVVIILPPYPESPAVSGSTPPRAG